MNAVSRCPSHAEIAAIGTPWACMIDAQLCLASCNRILCTPARPHSSEIAERIGMVGPAHFVDDAMLALGRPGRVIGCVVQHIQQPKTIH